MSGSIYEQLRDELLRRGFTMQASGALESPHNGLVLAEGHVPTFSELIELLDVMISRREKIFRSAGDVGVDVARRNYEDTVLVIDAIKAVAKKALGE